jgi:hypothetical protein
MLPKLECNHPTALKTNGVQKPGNTRPRTSELERQQGREHTARSPPEFQQFQSYSPFGCGTIYEGQSDRSTQLHSRPRIQRQSVISCGGPATSRHGRAQPRGRPSPLHPSPLCLLHSRRPCSLVPFSTSIDYCPCKKLAVIRTDCCLVVLEDKQNSPPTNNQQLLP